MSNGEVIPFPYVDCEALGDAVATIGEGVTSVAAVLKAAAKKAATKKAAAKKAAAKKAAAKKAGKKR
jgi:hypothetical protein